MSTPDEGDTSGHKKEVREQSAEERHVVAPTPGDVRGKAEDDEETEPPAADAPAP